MIKLYKLTFEYLKTTYDKKLHNPKYLNDGKSYV